MSACQSENKFILRLFGASGITKLADGGRLHTLRRNLPDLGLKLEFLFLQIWTIAARTSRARTAAPARIRRRMPTCASVRKGFPVSTARRWPIRAPRGRATTALRVTRCPIPADSTAPVRPDGRGPRVKSVSHSEFQIFKRNASAFYFFFF